MEKKSVFTLNKVFSIFIIFTGVIFFLSNAYIYSTGLHFVKEHHIYRFETGRFEAKEETDPITGKTTTLAPSFFKYYNKDGEEFNYLEVFHEYNSMNQFNDNLYQGVQSISVVVFSLSVISFFINLLKRVEYLGPILASVFSFLIFLEVGVLNIVTIFVSLGLFIGGYLMIKAKFVDYDKPYLPFVVKHNLDN